MTHKHKCSRQSSAGSRNLRFWWFSQRTSPLSSDEQRRLPAHLRDGRRRPQRVGLGTQVASRHRGRGFWRQCVTLTSFVAAISPMSNCLHYLRSFRLKRSGIVQRLCIQQDHELLRQGANQWTFCSHAHCVKKLTIRGGKFRKLTLPLSENSTDIKVPASRNYYCSIESRPAELSQTHS